MNKTASTHFPIDERLAQRWSPYIFSDRRVDPVVLRSIFEAARWSPSSFNEQPWRYIVGMQGQGEDHGKIVDCLSEGNQAWAEHAPVLIMGSYQKNFSSNGSFNKAAPHDLGLASAHMVFEASRHDLFVHMMIGLDPELARAKFEIPSDAEAYIAMAVGYRGEAGGSDSSLSEREHKPRVRIAQKDFVFSNGFGNAAEF